MTIDASFQQKLNRLREEVNERILAALQRSDPITLYQPMRYTLEAGGKRLRPILLLLACEAVGGDYRKALNAAVAVELLHTFTLIHDDVMDHDDTRRGRPTVHKKWDTSVAILSGDGLVALSYEFLLKTDHPRAARLGELFSKALLEVCEGQALDKEFESREEVSLDEYFSMIGKKTATLIALCGELGGMIGNGTPEAITALRNFGYHLGLAFQIQDDLLDILADEKQLGKTWGSDIMRKKKTLLLIHALQFSSEEDRRLIKKILQKPAVGREDVLRIKEIFQRSGTVDATNRLLQEHFEIARRELKKLPAARRNDLLNYLNLVVQRKH